METLLLNDYLGEDRSGVKHRAHVAIPTFQSGHAVEAHGHDYYECLVVLEGDLTHIVDDKVTHATDGYGCFLTPRSRHSITVNSNSAKIINVAVEPSTFAKLLPYDFLRNNHLEFACRQEELSTFHLYAKQISAHQEADEGQTADRYLNLFFHHAAILTTRDQDPADLIKNTPPWLDKAIQIFVDEHTNKDAHLFVELTGKTYEHVNRSLKKHYDCTVTEFINNIRIQRSSQLLRDSSEPVGKIANVVGFSDVNYFNRIFKRTYQCSPSQYRKRNMTLFPS